MDKPKEQAPTPPPAEKMGPSTATLEAEVISHNDVQPEREVQTAVANVQAKAQIAADEGGVFRPKTIDEGFRLAKAYFQSKLLPARYTSPEMVLTAMQMALELGLKPLIALRQIAVVNGSPALFGDLPLALVMQSGKLESIKEVWVDKDMNEICLANRNIQAVPYGAICVVRRKGDPEPSETFFTTEDAKTAGLYKNDVWNKYTKRMLRYRARSQGLKDKFPDALNGIAIAEYDLNVLPDLDEPQRALGTRGGEAQSIMDKLDAAT